jgi:cysteinyl-tRNA synthetase
LLLQAKTTLDGLYRRSSDAPPGAVDEGVLEALEDDLNTPLALSRLSSISDPSILKKSAQLLGLLSNSSEDWFQADAVSAAIEARIAERWEAKKTRKFERADAIRAELLSKGIILEDGPEGTTWRRE